MRRMTALEIAARTGPPSGGGAPVAGRCADPGRSPGDGSWSTSPTRPGCLEVAGLDRLGAALRRAGPGLRRIEHEDLEAAGRLQHHLAVVGDDRPSRQPLDLAHEGRRHDVLEAHPHLAHELAGATVAQRHLGRGEDVLEDDEDVLVEDHRARPRRALAVEVAHDADDRVGQRRLKLAGTEGLVMRHHR